MSRPRLGPAKARDHPLRSLLSGRAGSRRAPCLQKSEAGQSWGFVYGSRSTVTISLMMPILRVELRRPWLR